MITRPSILFPAFHIYINAFLCRNTYLAQHNRQCFNYYLMYLLDLFISFQTGWIWWNRQFMQIVNWHMHWKFLSVEVKFNVKGWKDWQVGCGFNVVAGIITLFHFHRIDFFQNKETKALLRLRSLQHQVIFLFFALQQKMMHGVSQYFYKQVNFSPVEPYNRKYLNDKNSPQVIRIRYYINL